MEVITRTAAKKSHQTANEVRDMPVHLHIDLRTGKAATRNIRSGYLFYLSCDSSPVA